MTTTITRYAVRLATDAVMETGEGSIPVFDTINDAVAAAHDADVEGFSIVLVKIELDTVVMRDSVATPHDDD